ncbi:MAG: hypothetical protein AABO58_01965 [Acidobacteriota bacterium]
MSTPRFAFPIPDAVMAAIFAVAATTDFFSLQRDELIFVLMVEGGFLLMQGTLVDIATRLKKRPPIWAVALIVAAVVLFSGEALDVLRLAWQRGLVVFLPLLVSLGERATVLWRMPDRPTIEKIAARALISNRITTALVLFALMTAAMLLGFDEGALAAGAIYFAVAAFDDWRVRGRRFAERPSVLFRFDPIGLEYLQPL